MNLVGDEPAKDVAGEPLCSGFRKLRCKASGKRKDEILPEHARGPGDTEGYPLDLHDLVEIVLRHRSDLEILNLLDVGCHPRENLTSV